MLFLTGKVISGNIAVDGKVKVKLDNNGQEVYAHNANGMIKKGSHVTLISDDMHSFVMVGTSKDGMDEVVNILVDLMSELIAMKTVDTGKHPTPAGLYPHDKIPTITKLKAKLEKFKL